MPDRPLKRCDRCLFERSVDEFYTHATTRDRLEPMCKACKSEINREQAARREQGREPLPDDAEKTCVGCGETKRVVEFKKRKDSCDGYRNDCKACSTKRNLAWQRANTDKHKAADARYRVKNPTLDRDYYLANKAQVNERNRRYWQENRDAMLEAARRWRAANPDWHREYARRYPDRLREGVARRVARIRGAFVENVSREVQFSRFRGVCYICLEPVDPDRWHLEHIIPLSRGGAHSYHNTGVSHPLCNQMKTDFLPEELLALGWPPLLLPGEYYHDGMPPTDVDRLTPIRFPKDVEDRLDGVL